jgi:hypothetical protein
MCCFIGYGACSSFPREQTVLNGFVNAVKHERYEDALKYCWNKAKVVSRQDGSKMVSLESCKPVVPKPGSFAFFKGDEHPDSWDALGMCSVKSWRLIRTEEWLCPKDLGYDVPPDTYILTTNSGVAVGFTTVRGSPKICFTHPLHG